MMGKYALFTLYLVLGISMFLGVYDYWVENHWGDAATISKVILWIDSHCKIFSTWFALWAGIGSGHFFFVRDSTKPANFIYRHRLGFILLLLVFTIVTCVIEYFGEVYWNSTPMIPGVLAWALAHCTLLLLVFFYWGGIETSRLFFEQELDTPTEK